MRVFLITILFIALGNACRASADDTLPPGVATRFLAFPFFLRSPETSWGFGGAGAYFFKSKKDDDTIRTSDINLISLYTLRKQFVVVLGSTVFFPGENKIFRFQSSYSYYPDKFWGIGNETPDESEENYTMNQFFFNPQLIFRCYRKLFLGFSFEMQNVGNFSFEQGGIFDEQNISGKYGGFASGIGALFTWDTRNNAYSPSRGSFVELNATRFTSALGSDFSFTSYVFDYRKFISVGRNRVLGAQLYSRVNKGDTPLRYLAMLGGPEMMRGYYKGRYTDQNLLAGQAEIRQYLFWRLGITGFLSAGQVAGAIHEFGLNDFHFTYGGGIRLLVNELEKLNLRVDFGFSKNSSGVYVLLKEAF